MELKINPTFRDLIQTLTGEEYEGLEQSVIADGCRDALVVWNGTILDGHNRYDICTRNNIPFQVIEMEFADESDAKMWIIKNQFGRRNLTAGQRSMLAMEYEKIFKAKGKENLKTSTGGDNPRPLSTLTKAEPINTRKELARLAGVSESTLYKVKTVKEKGTEEVKREMQSGKKSVSAAYRDTVTKTGETKICSICGKELPASKFHAGCLFCNSCVIVKRNYIPPELDLSLRTGKPSAVCDYTEEQKEYLDFVTKFYAGIGCFEIMPRAFDGISTDSEICKITDKLLQRLTAIRSHIFGGN